VPERALKARLVGVAAVEAICDNAFQAFLPEGVETWAPVSVPKALRIQEQLIFAAASLIAPVTTRSMKWADLAN
jgi:hypothetical protein